MTHETIMKAKKIFKAKINTGLYKHYPKGALKILYFDCLSQAKLIERCEANGI